MFAHLKLIAGVKTHLQVLVALMAWSGCAWAETEVRFARPNAVLGAQHDYLIRRWETEHGLPENSATSIVQTPDGYLWLGTFNGLVRFDGASFTTLDPVNTPELPSAGVINLHLDPVGRLWVSTLRGLAVLEQGRWTTLTSAQVSESNFARTFSSRGTVTCITSYNGRVWRAAGTNLTELAEPPGQQGAGYWGYVDPQGLVWVGQDHFFGHWDGQRWVASELQGMVTNLFRGMGTARDGSLLIATASELLRIQDQRVVSQRPLATDFSKNWQIFEDSNTNLWVCTQEKGVFRLSPGGELRRYTTDNGLSANSIRCAWEDKEGNLWLGTSGAGLMALTPARFEQMDLGALAPTRRITALLEERPGRMILGSYGNGLATVEQGKVSRLSTANGERIAGNVQALWRDPANNLWVGTFHDGVRVLQPDGSVRQIAEADSGGKDVAALLGDSRGRLWISGSETISVYEQGQFRPFRQAGLPPLANIKSFAEDLRSGTIWAGSTEGVFRYDGQQWSELKDANGQSLKETVCLRCEPDGTLWIGGSVAALRRLKDGRLVTLSKDNGLPVASVFSMVDDGRGYWWLGSHQGIARVARNALGAAAEGTAGLLEGQLFTESDGLPSVECVGGFQTTASRDQSGRLWFATTKGLVTVNPATFRLNTSPPPVHIAGFQFEDRAGRRVSFLSAPAAEVIIPPGQHELTAFFAALSFNAPEKVKFAYRIEELKDDWTDIGNRRSLYFFPPPPGHYRLWVKAANNDGIWNEAGDSLAFVVQPFFWQTLWFRALALGSLVGGTSWTVWRLGRTRLRHRIRSLEQQAEVERERLRLARILEATTDLVAFADQSLRLEFLNAAGRKMLGLGEREPADQWSLETLHPTSAARRLVETGLAASLKEGCWQGESVMRHRDGREIPVSQVLLVHRDTAGAVEWISLMARDITERKQAEEALRRSEETFARLFRQSPVAFGVSRLSTGTVIEVNGAMEQLTGFTREALVGRTTVELGMWRDEEERRTQMEELRTVGTIRGREMRLRLPGGRELVVQYVAERLEMAGEECVLTALHDVTERKRMVDALLAGQMLLRQFVQHAPAAVAMFDRELRYLQVSDRWCADYHLGGHDLVGRAHYEIFPDIPERWKEIHRRALAGSVERCDEDPFTRADGTVEWLQWEIRPWRNAAGEIAGIIMFTQVITERKQTLQQVQEQLAELQRWHRLTLDRENRVLQLKAEVNSLRQRLGEPLLYAVDTQSTGSGPS